MMLKAFISNDRFSLGIFLPVVNCNAGGCRSGGRSYSDPEVQSQGQNTSLPKVKKYKVKLSRYPMKTPTGERIYSSHLILTSALDAGEWSESRPGHALPPGKGPPVPIVQEAGWAPEPVWTQRQRKILCLCRGSNPGCTICSQTDITTYQVKRKLIDSLIVEVTGRLQKNR
jgi:hypothetical protein